MKKYYFKINFTYLKDCATVNSYGIVSAWGAKPAKQLFVSKMSQIYKNVNITDCIKLTVHEAIRLLCQ